MMKSHQSKNTSQSHLNKFYTFFDDIKTEKYDGMIITGAPVECMDYDKVNYWDELCEIMEWSKTHVTSTLHICWAAQAGLYYHFGVPKYDRDEKLTGVFTHEILKKKVPLVRSMDDYVNCPHSRNTEVRLEDILKHPELEVLAKSDEAGVLLVLNEYGSGSQVFIQGHPEYDRMTLSNEYHRDVAKGLNPALPKNYFTDNNPFSRPVLCWRNFSNTLYANWLNFYVYQNTPYELSNNFDWVI
jgi:homoserine O-succinyltransferase